jgi:hypothetical protein
VDDYEVHVTNTAGRIMIIHYSMEVKYFWRILSTHLAVPHAHDLNHPFFIRRSLFPQQDNLMLLAHRVFVFLANSNHIAMWPISLRKALNQDVSLIQEVPVSGNGWESNSTVKDLLSLLTPYRKITLYTVHCIKILMFYWPCITIYQYIETNVMDFYSIY